MAETGKVRLVGAPSARMCCPSSRTTLFTSASAVGLCFEVRLFPLPLSMFKTMNNLPVPVFIKTMNSTWVSQQSLIWRRSWSRRVENDEQYPGERGKEKYDEQ
ncbi:hypothetical protein CRG98_036903 [Punica granatum]|uniref:Uncharacterized protein n=1 Tax=Punica granatum TaxID=22663 RepID=A0A2I0IFI3_PUNGR|nr:hypothetical protein CRG98_036903 [Punica granatum]